MRIKHLIALLTATLMVLVSFASDAEETTYTMDPCGLRGYDANAGWQYVVMGEYPYDKDGTPAPVLWQVLAVEDGKALLYTTYIIDAHQCTEVSGAVAENKKYPDVSDYGETDLNRWLNETMIQNLLGQEPVLSAVTEEQYGRLYPLTDIELMNEAYGFTNQRFYEVRSRWAYATPYALNVKLYPNYGSKLQKDRTYGTASYWVAALKRNDKTSEQIPGKRMQICAGIADPHEKGGTNIGHLSNSFLNRTSMGLRLAVRLDTSKIQVISGSGTIWDPCRLAFVTDKNAEEKEILTPLPVSASTPAPTTPAPVNGRPTLAPPEAVATPVPVPDWIR